MMERNVVKSWSVKVENFLSCYCNIFVVLFVEILLLIWLPEVIISVTNSNAIRTKKEFIWKLFSTEINLTKLVRLMSVKLISFWTSITDTCQNLETAAWFLILPNLISIENGSRSFFFCLFSTSLKTIK